jgi:aryl-alcohol dehydrogenase-like predicted oxidoreductase
VTPTAVSLAYVLSQAFPTLAVIGPKTRSHLAQSFEALALELEPTELSWLDLSEPQ